MSTYLLSWNPKKSSFTDERYRAEFPDAPGNWDIGSLKRSAPETGDDWFLVRTGKRNGVKPTGIIAYGTFLDTEDGEHWRDEKYQRGEITTYIRLNTERQVQCLDYPERVLSVDILKYSDLTHTVGAPQASMIRFNGGSVETNRLKKTVRSA